MSRKRRTGKLRSQRLPSFASSFASKPRKHWWELIHKPPVELANGYDAIELNLLCAEGLPGAESIDIPACQRVADEMARHVQRETERHLYRFRDKPEEFQHSQGYFRMLVLITVLQQDCGVFYKTELNDKDDRTFFSNPEHLFVHGVLQRRGGTCASLPVVYLAIARRLGYPVRLVMIPNHLLVRWIGPNGGRVNVEGSSNGFISHPDEYYLTWPRAITVAEAEKYHFGKSMTLQEEFATFLRQRGTCLEANERFAPAAKAYAWAAYLDPRTPLALDALKHVLNRWTDKLTPLIPPGFPFYSITEIKHQLIGIPIELEKEIILREMLEQLLVSPKLKQKWWDPLRQNPGVPPPDLPKKLVLQPGAFKR